MSSRNTQSRDDTGIPASSILVPPADRFAANTERALWAAHVRAAQLLDDEPGPVARNILSAVNQHWRQTFLKVDT